MLTPKYHILDFMPYCMLPKKQCEAFFGHQKTQPHRHILPIQQTIFNSTAMYLYMQGGVGGGKSEGFARKCVYLALTIPRNRGVVARYNINELIDSSWRKVVDCIESLVIEDLIPEPVASKKEGGVPLHYRFHNGSELQGVHSKNWRRAMGADHGFFWVDDALETSKEFFIGTGGVTAGLLSRLRLPAVRYDSRTYDETTRPHGSLHGMVSSNPPHYGHWLHDLFGKDPGIHRIGEDSVEWLHGETLDNPFSGGSSYAKSLISAQVKMGATRQTIDRVVYGKSVPAYKGKPVFPQFDHAKHVAPLKYKPELPLIAGWDFGFLHPAIIFAHLYKCKHGSTHYFTISEIGNCFNSTVHNLYKSYYKPHVDALYMASKSIFHGGDQAGYRSSSSNKDSRGDMKVLINEYHMPFRKKFLNLEPSLQYMRSLLEPKHPCKCGLELILISDKCPMLIAALEGGYHYADKGQNPKPTEDRYFADVACAWRYGAENFLRGNLPYQDAHAVALQRQAQAQQQRLHAAMQTSYGWMDLPDADLVHLITAS